MLVLELAVDIGGTFTDLVGYDRRTGQPIAAKAPTTPEDVTRGIRSCLQKAGIDVGQASRFVHGSTVAINTAIERTGARTALVVTRGTRDLYTIGRGNRPNAYDIHFRRPVPLVPPHLTFEVDERLGPRGDTWLPFDEEQARSVASAIAASGAEAIAVCLLHSWCEPEHERRMGAILTELVPHGFVTVSHEILREYGEYERISTTALNAYLGPRVAGYLERLEQMLRDAGFAGELAIMQSNGGAMSASVARAIPVAMLESGPVGGFLAAAEVGESLGYPDVIAFDMGGTTAKTNLVRHGAPRMAHGYHIGGYAEGLPVMLPVVDTVEVGSGGGSVAWIDEAGALQVGPRSAGAEPGPICYGRGGTQPTVTDANLVLGRLAPSALLGGEMQLDAAAARHGVEERIGRPLGLSAEEAALAIVKVAVLKMALAVREVSVARGHDPRDFALVAFGGAGPLHAAEVARELHVPTVIVPNVPGQLSAAGMLVADVKHDYVRTCSRALDRADLAELRGMADELVDTGRRRLEDQGVAPDQMAFPHVLEVRYAGQDFTMPVPAEPDAFEAGGSTRIRARFEALHEQQFGYHDPDRGLEIVNLRVVAVGRRPSWPRPAVRVAPGPHGRSGGRAVYFDEADRPVEAAVIERDRLAAGATVDGPAIVQEYGSTTVLFPGDLARVAPTGELLVLIRGGAR